VTQETNVTFLNGKVQVKDSLFRQNSEAKALKFRSPKDDAGFGKRFCPASKDGQKFLSKKCPFLWFVSFGQAKEMNISPGLSERTT